mmetsp:Transcript_143318/g.445499  ORF Transcript_143318/g.445499 Transcript_143318/m.445499 type:complete len:308 (+) Transcript_143318:1578-2501(+)
MVAAPGQPRPEVARGVGGLRRQLTPQADMEEGVREGARRPVHGVGQPRRARRAPGGAAARDEEVGPRADGHLPPVGPALHRRMHLATLARVLEVANAAPHAGVALAVAGAVVGAAPLFAGEARIGRRALTRAPGRASAAVEARPRAPGDELHAGLGHARGRDERRQQQAPRLLQPAAQRQLRHPATHLCGGVAVEVRRPTHPHVRGTGGRRLPNLRLRPQQLARTDVEEGPRVLGGAADAQRQAAGERLAEVGQEVLRAARQQLDGLRRAAHLELGDLQAAEWQGGAPVKIEVAGCPRAHLGRGRAP